jgi:hypothetical protein
MCHVRGVAEDVQHGQGQQAEVSGLGTYNIFSAGGSNRSKIKGVDTQTIVADLDELSATNIHEGVLPLLVMEIRPI